MAWQYNKHYSRDEACALLPQVGQWISELTRLQEELKRYDQRLASLLSQGDDIGGESANRWAETVANIKSTLAEFQSREIQLKDLDRGLVDFPAIIGGREVFLCWKVGEDDIHFWHELDGGYAGRERI